MDWEKKDTIITGAAKSIVRIAQVVPQPVRTSGNFQEFTIKISYGQVRNTSGNKGTSKSKSDFAGPVSVAEELGI